MVSQLPDPIKQLAIRYEHKMLEGDLSSRLAHHLGRVATEQWF